MLEQVDDEEVVERVLQVEILGAEEVPDAEILVELLHAFLADVEVRDQELGTEFDVLFVTVLAFDFGPVIVL